MRDVAVSGRILTEAVLAAIATQHSIAQRRTESNAAFARRLRAKGHLTAPQCKSLEWLVKTGNHAAHKSNGTAKFSLGEHARHSEIAITLVTKSNAPALQNNGTNSADQTRAAKTTIKWKPAKRNESESEGGGCYISLLIAAAIVVAGLVLFMLIPETIEPETVESAFLREVTSQGKSVEALIGVDPNDANDAQVVSGTIILATHRFKRDGRQWFGGYIQDETEFAGDDQFAWIASEFLTAKTPEIADLSIVRRGVGGSQASFTSTGRRTFVSGYRAPYSIRVQFDNVSPSQQRMVVVQQGQGKTSIICDELIEVVSGFLLCPVDFDDVGSFSFEARLGDAKLGLAEQIQIVPGLGGESIETMRRRRESEPSFDCDGHLDRMKAIICFDPTLAQIDREFRSAYDSSKYYDLSVRNQQAVDDTNKYFYNVIYQCDNELNQRECVIKAMRSDIHEINYYIENPDSEFFYIDLGDIFN